MTETEILEALDELGRIAGTDEPAVLEVDFRFLTVKGITVWWAYPNGGDGEVSADTISGAIDAARAEMLRPEPPAV